MLAGSGVTKLCSVIDPVKADALVAFAVAPKPNTDNWNVPVAPGME